MSFLVLLFLAIGKKIKLADRIALKEALNQDSFNIVSLLIRIFKYTLFFELIGAILLAINFVPQFGWSKGIFYSVFHSISAFCNAGIDILGNNSFINYNSNVIVNFAIMFLIIVGGLGFTVWVDVVDLLRKCIKEKISFRKAIKELTLHTKIVMIATFILLLTGTILIFTLEYNNRTTMANNSIGEKLLKSAFQSTTLRTAGFASINQNEMTTVTKLISICYMFVGGSPGSTAGGIKNVTMFIVIMLVLTYMKDKEKINVFKRNIPDTVIRRAIVVFAISIFIVIIATVALLLSETFLREELLSADIADIYNISFMDTIFEVVSAFATVGLTLGITTKLTFAGKIIIICLMIIGRLRTYDYFDSFI